MDVCQLADRWGISIALAWRLLDLAYLLEARGLGAKIISGARSREKQRELEAEGRPTAPFDQSTHADTDRDGCARYATGADLRITAAGVDVVTPDRWTIAVFGASVVEAGLRWGGGSPKDPGTGIPSDWRHVDLGPRTS